MEIPKEPDEKKVYDLLRNVGMSEDGAYIAVQEIRTMAGQNIIAKLDAQEARLDTRIDQMETQTAELKVEVRGFGRNVRAIAVAFGVLVVALQIVVGFVTN